MLPDGWTPDIIGDVAKLSKTKYDPKTATENPECVELEHIEQASGVIIGSASAKSLSSIKTRFSKGDVLFGKLRPYLKKYANPNFSGVCSTEIWALKPVSDKITSDYLFQIVQSQPFLDAANKSCGTKMPRAEWGVVADAEIALPPLAEQKRIAEVLGSVDAAIEATKAVIDQTKMVKKGLFQTLLTRGIGHTKFKGSPLGEIPESWEVKTIGDTLASCVYGISKSLSSDPVGTPILRMGNLQDDKLALSDLKYADLSDEKPEQVFLKKDDIVFNRTNSLELVGKVALVETDAPLGFASYLLRLRTNQDNSSRWLFRVMSSSALQITFRDIATRGASQVNINPTKMRALEIPVPPLAEQVRIDEAFDIIDIQIDHEVSKLAALQTLKKGLMDDLLTGKVRVNELKVETANNVIPFDGGTSARPKAASLRPERLHAVVMAEVVYQLLDRPDFGSKKRQKITDLAIRLAGLDMEANLQATRAAAGPYDHASRHVAEEIFHREQWFTWREMPSRQIRYFRGASFGAHRHDFNQLPDSTKASIQRTIDLLKEETPQKAEIIDTAFVAWNDLILSGNPEPTNQQIVEEVLGWHPDKSKISNADWVAGIRWIRDKNICPTGTGVSTRERQHSLL